MEGLSLARLLRELTPQLPAANLGWAFPDETTAALLLDLGGERVNLVLNYRPPNTVVFLSRERLRGAAGSPFQRLLETRAVGDLTRAEQHRLDRVMVLHFAGAGGFVPRPPLRVVFEVTGRNGNLIVLEAGEDLGGRIVAAAREIPASRNRYRTVRAGGLYVPPPPYEKADPRALTDADRERLRALPLSGWRGALDGLGPLLGAELARRAGFAGVPQDGAQFAAALAALDSVVQDPTADEAALGAGLKEAAHEEKAEALRRALRAPLEKRRTLLTHRLGDLTRAEEGSGTAAQEREEADLLMAYAAGNKPGAGSVTVPTLSGEGTVTIALDPALGAVQNAEKRYARARRREEVYLRLLEQEDDLRRELAEVEAELRALEATPLSELSRLEREQGAAQRAPRIGLRLTSPGGFAVMVGRNNKENAAITHRLAHKTDTWFHAQGYPGSHVVVRGAALPLEDILFAARLAAHHSKVRGAGQVAVDYTPVKAVWRVRGAPAGQVSYTGQKTVWVNPSPTGREEDSPR